MDDKKQERVESKNRKAQIAAEQKKKDIDNWRQVIAEDKKKKELAEIQKKKQSEDVLKKKRKEFKKKENERLDEFLSKNKEADKLKEESVKKAEEEKRKIEEHFKEKVDKKTEPGAKLREKELQYNMQLQQTLNNWRIKEFFETYNHQLKELFGSFINLRNDTTIRYDDYNLQYKNFFTMCQTLEIYPQLVSFDDFKLLYRSATGHKNVDKHTPFPLSFDKFQEVLLRIAIKSQGDCKNIYEANTNGKTYNVPEKQRGDTEKNWLNDFSNERKVLDEYNFPVEKKRVKKDIESQAPSTKPAKSNINVSKNNIEKAEKNEQSDENQNNEVDKADDKQENKDEKASEKKEVGKNKPPKAPKINEASVVALDYTQMEQWLLGLIQFFALPSEEAKLQAKLKSLKYKYLKDRAESKERIGKYALIKSRFLEETSNSPKRNSKSPKSNRNQVSDSTLKPSLLNQSKKSMANLKNNKENNSNVYLSDSTLKNNFESNYNPESLENQSIPYTDLGMSKNKSTVNTESIIDETKNRSNISKESRL